MVLTFFCGLVLATSVSIMLRVDCSVFLPTTTTHAPSCSPLFVIIIIYDIVIVVVVVVDHNIQPIMS